MPAPPPSRNSARKVLLAAAAVLVVGAVMVVLGSGMPPVDERSPYASAIVAVELARTPAEIAAALGPAGTEARDAMRSVVRADFMFLVAYPLLSLAIVWFLTRARAARGVGAALAAAMVVGDALENVALLGIFEEISAARLASLTLWTTVKWAALFASAALMAGLLVARGGAARMLAVVPAITAVAGGVGLAVAAQRRLVEIAGLTGMGATWLVVAAMAAVVVGARRR